MINFIAVKKPNMLKLGREIDFNYAHVRNVLRQFQDEEIIKPVFNQSLEERGYKIQLTKKGMALDKILQMFLDISNNHNIDKLTKELNKLEVKNGKQTKRRNEERRDYEEREFNRGKS